MDTDYSNLINKFIDDFCGEEDEILKNIRRDTEIRQIHPRMLSSWYQASLLNFMVKITNSRLVLEIGTFTAYSTISMGRALPNNGQIFSIEKNDELEDTIKKNIAKAGLEDKTKIITGDALEIMSDLDMLFDLIFIDGDKREYLSYFKNALNILNDNGLIIVDNVLWSNKIFTEPASNDYMTKSIIDFNAYIKSNPNLQTIVLPVRDGIMLIRRKN